MKKITFLPLLLLCCFAMAQSVGIGTPSPNSASILDLGQSIKPMILPRLTSSQMDGVLTPALGMLHYNIDEGQLYSYMRYRTNVANENNRWQPISTGPRMLAWGVVDSFGVETNGNLTYDVSWDATNRWYRMVLASPHQYYKDSMLLIVTAVGNGSWAQTISTGELIESTRIASIKFTDAFRVAGGFSSLDARRRSNFHFVLYDLRKQP